MCVCVCVYLAVTKEVTRLHDSTREVSWCSILCYTYLERGGGYERGGGRGEEGRGRVEERGGGDERREGGGEERNY